MIKRLPIIATIVVVAAAATMVALGFWQLGRAQEKDELLARYAAASLMTSEVDWPIDADEADEVLFRRSIIDCQQVLSFDARAGTSARGAKGWGHYANCSIARSDQAALVALGWTREITTPEWDGGNVSGIIAPGPRLVVTEPVAGLEPLSAPDPADVPNNHLAYAGQWFFFALTALLIFGLAIRKRNKERA
jgi:surfeit locus 1 family protein